ncbi:MAG: HIG1 domain-containing protein [Pseudomonadota bacterium]
MTIWFILALVAAFATAAVMVVGLVSMGRGGDFNARYGNLLMRLRVAFQGLAIVMLLIWVATS